MMDFERAALTVFKKHLLEQFESYKMKYTTISDEKSFAHFISKGVDQALHYNIVDDEDILVYIHYMLTKGEDFDTADPKVSDLLQNPRFDGEEKLEELDIYFNESKGV